MKVVRVLVKIHRFIGVAFDLIIIFLVRKENAFASKIVRINKEGGQKVISTGPYAIVEHPMYTGLNLNSMCFRSFSPFCKGAI